MLDTQSDLPSAGFIREPKILPLFSISRSTWWAWVKEGKAPAGVKLSRRITAWRVEDIRALIASMGK